MLTAASLSSCSDQVHSKERCPDSSAVCPHARDADFILGDNGNIYRLVGVNGVGGGSFLSFTYDNYGPLKIIPRAVQTLDYTVGTRAPADLGGDDTLHGEAGIAQV